MDAETEILVRKKFDLLEPILDEQSRRLWAAAEARTGLTINAELDINLYEKGIHVSDEELKTVNLTKAKFHGEWNYSIAAKCSS